MTTITIGGREFRVGAAYRPRLGDSRPRILMVAWDKLAEVEWAHTVNSPWRICSYRAWLRWAGDEVAP
jgi:hypothetical protein